ncbi:MAG: carboxypeptidase regulatory-like domain-containing protein [Alphaproteobacteria bacterium]|nr:carboxypeptidase regulatory-like domain-containing protein [Alphaproteobacteria bacterium]
MVPSLSLLLSLSACTPTSTIDGKVVDIWGNPIEGATVMVVGGSERPLTDADGRYHLLRVDGKLEIKAGRKGYIQDHAEVDVKPGELPPGPLFQLYPKPEAPGFWLVTPGKYVRLDQRLVHSVGNSLRTVRGIQSLGEAEAEVEQPKIVFHTELRQDEIERIGLELHRLKFVDETQLTAVTGQTAVSVNLYVDDGEVPIEVSPLRSKTDYLVTPKEPLKPGGYAFQTQELLSPGENDRFDEIPEELRIVFAFGVR